ncbi:tumor necrosis factor receptor superfamily member 5 [Leptodactylus fuscus]|uniref:tumor necrosis factor receptor superfamily member 5 n=1 Tax=Leptodactylus fuscus TaxID=238119 RepID=UPI003F4E4B35
MYPWIILLILGSHYCQSSDLLCEDNNYDKDGRCCSLCKPGQRLLRDCTEHNDTMCIACDHGQYQDKYNRETSCLLHRMCNERLGFEKIREGTPTMNVDCRCQLGRHCSSQACETCVFNKKCGPGEGVVHNATIYSDTQCSQCSEGTYSATESDTESCKNWSKCGKSETVIQKGTPTNDVICGPSPAPDHSNVWVYVVVVVALLVIACLAVIFIRKSYLKNRKDKNKAKPQEPPEENKEELLVIPKEYNLPEEDQDDQDITMQGLPVAQEQGKDWHMSQEEV